MFDLARSIDLHTQSTSRTREQAIAGVTSGLIGLGDEVTWGAQHFGVWQTLTVRVTEFERPAHFADVMVRGAFHSMEHHHHFEESGGGTVMRDVFTFQSPLGPLGPQRRRTPSGPVHEGVPDRAQSSAHGDCRIR